MLRIHSIFKVQFWDIQTKVEGWQLIKNGSHSNSVIKISVRWNLPSISVKLNINGALLDLSLAGIYRTCLEHSMSIGLRSFSTSRPEKREKIHDFKFNNYMMNWGVPDLKFSSLNHDSWLDSELKHFFLINWAKSANLYNYTCPHSTTVCTIVEK